MTRARSEDRPYASGEMAERVGGFDWTSTSLGPTDAWSERLKLMVEQVLASPLVSSLVCGPERVLIYNDAAARLYGDRHPMALGRPLPETFPEGWMAVSPLYERAFAGETVQVAGQSLDTRGEGEATDVFDALLTPVRESDGRVVHVHMTGFEIGARARAEAALRMSEALRRIAIDGGGMGTWRWDLRNRLVWGDARFLALWGLPPSGDAHPLSLFVDRMSPTGAGEMAEMVAKAVAAGEAFDGQLAVVVGPTSGRWVRWRGRAEQERPWIVNGVSFDVTEQRVRDERLRESETRHRLLIDSWSQAVWETDAHGVVAADSPSWRAYTGQTLEGWLGYGWLNAIHPDDRAYAERQWRDAMAAHSFVDAEFRLRTSEGGWRWTNVHAAPVLDKREQIEKWVGMNIDIDVRKRAEAALIQNETRQRALIEGIPQLVWRAVDSGAWTWASPQWTAFTGQPEPDSHHLGWLEPVHPDDRPRAMAAWKHALKAGGFGVEYRIRRAADGAYRWFQTRATPVRDRGGAILEWLGTSTDIDDLRRLRERQDVMVAELQHRTRNLIAVVKGVADDTMRETGPTEAFRDAFADRLSALSRVQGLLSRSEAEPITIGALVRLELDALGASAAGDRVAVEGPEVFLRPSTVQTLALALHELATNARKYGALSHDGGRLAVTWRERDEGDEHRLAIEWVETGLEQVSERPASENVSGGYGRELIEHALPYALGARTSYALSASGLRCAIDMPARPGKGGGP